ncbi:hypothetical protein Pint_20743 [Pistacia integerrima]|uniref:Uncharacterized protein n=1 Tax=Pistacia integerrima TaxID=434235 RepID=A0ACC0XCH5_9ROSI|nr:hypothetical protein Pint_20743 [Pistacia integerrima]
MNSIYSFLLFLFILPVAYGGLKDGFYATSCPRAEFIIREVVKNRLDSDPSITAALLRMQFHDCFVRGCDASLLIEPSQKEKEPEKLAPPNKTVRGYELMNEAKEKLEKECNSTVSCADIIAVATRDAVELAGGPRYEIPTGRRDGLESKASQVNLPSPTLPIPQAVELFKDKGFSAREMVTLLGGHTVGIAHCSNVNTDRMHPGLSFWLTTTCASDPDKTVKLDQGTPEVVDNEFYTQISLGRGVLKLDQDLPFHGLTSGAVSEYRENLEVFRADFAKAMIKLGTVGVLVDGEGEIRNQCWAFNN